jgi:hypothetical protein
MLCFQDHQFFQNLAEYTRVVSQQPKQRKSYNSWEDPANLVFDVGSDTIKAGFAGDEHVQLPLSSSSTHSLQKNGQSQLYIHSASSLHFN